MDDSGTSIGRRYARTDEIGIPFAITVDFQTVEDRTVTVRERDTMAQVRVPLADVARLIADLAAEGRTWAQVRDAYPSATEGAATGAGGGGGGSA